MKIAVGNVKCGQTVNKYHTIHTFNVVEMKEFISKLLLFSENWSLFIIKRINL